MSFFCSGVRASIAASTFRGVDWGVVSEVVVVSWDKVKRSVGRYVQSLSM